MGITESKAGSPTGPRLVAGPTPLAKPSPASVTPKTPADSLQIQGAGASQPLGWVHVQGTQLVDESGKPVSVRGVNLGGWLVQEPWMMPLASTSQGAPAIKDQTTLWQTVANRFGASEMNKIRDAYRSAWLSDADFANMKAAGITTVRVPFTYADLQEPDGYKWLDWEIQEASKHGLYTILDLHGAPGGQSSAMHTGQADQNQFFKNPADVQKAAQMWQDLAKRYANNPAVLGYDLLNEPMGAQSTQQLYQAQNALYQAIRQVDPKHVIFFEDGYKGVDTFPDPKQYGWKNVAFSIHQYDFNGTSDQQLKALQSTLNKVKGVEKKLNVPVYIGEFNMPGTDEKTISKAVGALNDAKVPWTMWTYKVVTTGSSDKSVWGLYRNTPPVQGLDVAHDTEAQMLAKIDQMRTENLQAVPGEIAMFQHEPSASLGYSSWQLFTSRIGDGLSAAWNQVHAWSAGLGAKIKQLI
ncbi:MAG TPA: cellulase family glycosylhydrolase [Oscillatoriaceae cyanobacterium]